ncbi:MAG: hypothetical protein QM775_24710 [Pirellulales bacterium]
MNAVAVEAIHRRVEGRDSATGSRGAAGDISVAVCGAGERANRFHEASATAASNKQRRRICGDIKDRLHFAGNRLVFSFVGRTDQAFSLRVICV